MVKINLTQEEFEWIKRYLEMSINDYDTGEHPRIHRQLRKKFKVV